jgi:hypothetical protein
MTEDARSYRAEPEPRFADRLERDLLRRFAAGAQHHVATDPDPVVELPPAVDLVSLEETSAETTVDFTHARHDGSGRRRALVAAGAVAAAVLLIAATALLQRDDSAQREPAGPGPTSTIPTPGTTGERPPDTEPGDASTEGPLLPAGAPSTPYTGELVASAGQVNAPGAIHSYRVYADGRLISSTGSAGENGYGYVEQRLTPEGVERVRSVFLSSGLFDNAPRPWGEPCDPLGIDTVPQVCVRGDDGQLRIAWGSKREVARLLSYLMTLDLSLPENEWADPHVRPYVASRIRTCLGTYVDIPNQVVLVPHDLSILMAAFPQRVVDVLRGNKTGSGDDPPFEDLTCFDVTLDEARTLVDEFLSPSGRGSHEYWGIVVSNPKFNAVKPDATPGIVAFFNFQELLPDGVPAAPVI